MSRNVFANGREISAKKDGNRSIAAMADVCLSPPSPPAGPVPIPYPNTAEASDTSDGSKSVVIGGGEVGLKNVSNYKKSTGDEAATRTLGMGVVTHTIQGKLKHAAWSMDVKIEGQNVIRHMDITTHNHMNCPNVALTLDAAAQALAQIRELTCEELDATNAEERAAATADGSSPPTMITAYRETGDGTGSYMKSRCPSDPDADVAGGFQPPVAAQDQPACGGGRRPGYRQRNHAENKILHPEMDAQLGGKIKLNMWHPSPNPPPAGDSAPCSSCRQSICEAEACGIQVYLCRSSGRPPEAVRPAAAGLCPPDEDQGDYDPAWQQTGLGGWPE